MNASSSGHGRHLASPDLPADDSAPPPSPIPVQDDHVKSLRKPHCTTVDDESAAILLRGAAALMGALPSAMRLLLGGGKEGGATACAACAQADDPRQGELPIHRPVLVLPTLPPAVSAAVG